LNKWLIRSLKSKTIIFSIILASLGAIQASLELFNAVLSPAAYGLITMVVGAIVAALRIITTVPLDRK